MTPAENELSPLFPGDGFYLSKSDRGVFQRAFRVLTRGTGHVAMYSENKALLDHYLGMLLTDLRSSAGCTVEIYRPGGAMQLLERFNAILASLSIDEARAKKRNTDQILRIWLLEDLESLPEDELDLLARLLKDFPSSRVVLLMCGYEMRSLPAAVRSAFRMDILDWHVELPDPQDLQQVAQAAVQMGYQKELGQLLLTAGMTPGTAAARTSETEEGAEEITIGKLVHGSGSSPVGTVDGGRIAGLEKAPGQSLQQSTADKPEEEASPTVDWTAEDQEEKGIRWRRVAALALLLPGGIAAILAGLIWVQSETSWLDGSPVALPGLEGISWPFRVSSELATGTEGVVDSPMVLLPPVVGDESALAPQERLGSSVTPAPVTPAPVTPAPVTPAPVTPAPVTPAPRDLPSEEQPAPSALPVTEEEVTPAAQQPIAAANEAAVAEPVVDNLPVPDAMLAEIVAAQALSASRTQPRSAAPEAQPTLPPTPPEVSAEPAPLSPLSPEAFAEQMRLHMVGMQNEFLESWFVQKATHATVESAQQALNRLLQSSEEEAPAYWIRYQTAAGRVYYAFLEGPFADLDTAQQYIRESEPGNDYWVRSGRQLAVGIQRQ